jgi:hypothetical protein
LRSRKRLSIEDLWSFSEGRHWNFRLHQVERVQDVVPVGFQPFTREIFAQKRDIFLAFFSVIIYKMSFRCFCSRSLCKEIRKSGFASRAEAPIAAERIKREGLFIQGVWQKDSGAPAVAEAGKRREGTHWTSKMSVRVMIDGLRPEMWF